VAATRSERIRRVLAPGLALLSLAWVVVLWIPWPVFPLWMLHFVALEASLLGAALAGLTVALSWPRRATSTRRWPLALAVPTLAVLLAPALMAVPAYRREQVRFSLFEYVRGVRAPSIEVRRDVVLDGAGPGRELDLYLPPTSGPHPLVVTVHGGSWRGGDKGTAEWLSRELAARGHLVADVRYRLAPNALFPAAVGDVKCITGLLRARIDLAVDPQRVALLGRSAGGQIALVAAYSAGDARVPPACAVEDLPVAAVAALYAPTDLAWGYDNPARPDVVKGPESLELYLGGTPRTHAELYRLASPPSWVFRPLPRTLLVHGTSDRLVRLEHLRRLQDALTAAGRPVRTLEVPLADHGFDVRGGGIGEQLARAVLLEFLDGSRQSTVD
jgi:acetyl esterase/lipase